ncbi:hypothetical protein BD289DRAFT_489421 [Coniella lustricola]|uniref:Uncharacterized protein n=1 Tax=Coniella lustricola TaxID=2025994 RepID=A0A2T3A269_9PEZI|nr:hypothetical protein BD289DRAFT_489421 [Coniella lustricola]
MRIQLFLSMENWKMKATTFDLDLKGGTNSKRFLSSSPGVAAFQSLPFKLTLSKNPPITPIVPTGPLSGRAIEFGLEDADPVLVLSREITLAAAEFSDSCTTEAWIQPGTGVEYAAGSTSTIFGMQQGSGPSLILDEKLILALSDPSPPSSILWRSELRLQEGAWNHVTLIISGSIPRTAVLITNNQVSAPFELSSEHMMALQRIVSRADSPDSGFCGSVDEGRVAHDATENSNHINILLNNPVATDGWTASQAPVRQNTGPTRQVLRLPNDIVVSGGISVATHYAQVSISPTDMNKTGSASAKEASARKTANKTETNPLKRNARVLLYAVTSRQGISGNRPLLLDFALLSDGNLGGIPGELSVPSLAIAGTPPKASTSLIFIDPAGTELFAVFLAFPQAACLDHAPSIWEAAIGGVTLYLRAGIECFGALPYNITRSIAVGISATLSSHENIMVATKLRLAKRITIITQRCKRADPAVAVDIMLSAKMQDNKSSISETWRGVPSSLANLCDIINSSYAFGIIPNAVMQSYAKLTSSSSSSSDTRPLYNLNLTKHLTKDLPVATCLMVGTACVQTAAASIIGSTSFIVSSPYCLDSVACTALTPLKALRGTFIFFLSYNYENLVSYRGKGVGSFKSGSTKSTFKASSETPYFAPLRQSTALSLDRETALSISEKVTTTDACTGLTFESWIKVDNTTTWSIPIAHTSEKKSRASSGRKNKAQTFMLTVVQKSNNQEDDRTYAHVNFGNYVEFNANKVSVLFHLHLTEIGSHNRVLLSKAPGLNNPAPFQINILHDGYLRLQFWKEKNNNNKPAAGPTTFYSATKLDKNTSYKVFISRKIVNVKSRITCGPVHTTDTPLMLGGAPHTNTNSIIGQIGGFKIWSTAIELPDDLTKWKAESATKSQVGSYSFTSPEHRTSSPFSGDARLTTYINGKQQEVKRTTYYSDQLNETVKTRESIYNTLYSRLTDVPPKIAIYLSFNKTVIPSATRKRMHSASILDESLNCWHLSVVQGRTNSYAPRNILIPSRAPVGLDASCVTPLLRKDGMLSQMPRLIRARSSVAKYGDLTIGVNGAIEGSFKRAYTFINNEAPTLKGYIEGAPPVPADNYLSRDDRPSSAIRYVNAQRCSYSYSSHKEVGAEVNLAVSRGVGAKWEASAGIGMETVVSQGEIKAAQKRVVDISSSALANEVSTTTTHSTVDMGVELTGSWTARDSKDRVQYQPTNTGIALVESETADVSALRLKLQGSVKPLVAYQMRPNPDIPKDRNLVSFHINPFYTKQGCLDGRRGLEDDKSYPGISLAGPPKDVSYFKPAEAYALRDHICRTKEQLRGEHERYSMLPKIGKRTPPKRNKRNICNSYEIGGNANMRVGLGVSMDMELSVSGALSTINVDALLAAHFNMMLTKESNSETSLELQAELPPPIDIHVEDPVTKQLAKRPGTVDTYQWMSFWLEPSIEDTAAFFQQVVDRDALTLRNLSSALKSEKANAPTKAWRVFHRCTYVSRVPEQIVSSTVAATVQTASTKIVHDYAPSWQLISKLEPYLRSAKDRSDVSMQAKPHVQRLWPVLLLSQPRLYNQVIDILVEYLGVAEQ